VSVVLVGDEAIADLHGRFLGDPRPTDVLTFDLRDDSRADTLEGEIIISVETARRHARRLRIDAADEILRCCVHGVLHLLGYDDRTPAGRRQMRRAENRLLASL
jgi:probable rRNA maturation factor